MATRPLVAVQTLEQNDSPKMVELPAVFSAPIRNDVVQQVFTNMNKNHRQPYAVSDEAAMQTAAHSWGTGRAVSRIPRVHGSGTRRSGQAAFGNMCRGGRMFAPTKTWRKWHRKISRGQRRYATVAALAATSVPALVMARGHRVENVNEIPLVVDAEAIYSVSRTNEAVDLLKKVEAFADVERVKNSKKVRAGKGKARNRRYVMRRGPLVIYGKEDSSIVQAFRNIPGVELCHVSRLNLLQLAPGGHLGRFVVWTETAFGLLDEIFGTWTENSKQKKNYHLPYPKMRNTDVSRIINSDEVQSVLRPKVVASKFQARKKNPLRNLGAMVKLNPYAVTQKRRAILANETTQKKKQARRAVNKTYSSFLFEDINPSHPFVVGVDQRPGAEESQEE